MRAAFEREVLTHSQFPIEVLILAWTSVLWAIPMLVDLIELGELTSHVSRPLFRNLILDVTRSPHQRQVLRIAHGPFDEAASGGVGSTALLDPLINTSLLRRHSYAQSLECFLGRHLIALFLRDILPALTVLSSFLLNLIHFNRIILFNKV